MTQMVYEVYDALKSINVSDEKATAVAKALGNQDAKLDEVKFDLKNEIREFRSELKEDISNVRSELKEDISNVRSELKEDISNVRSELKRDIVHVSSELKEQISGVKSDIKVVYWILGVIVTMNVGILLMMVRMVFLGSSV